jgi:phosphatidylethanolamine-binding protein (PEBP) family uncharacterized protein
MLGRSCGSGGGTPAALPFSVGWGPVQAAPAAAATAAPPLLEAAALSQQPAVTLPAGGPYTLIAWDPDAPQASWLHWLVVNIPGGSAYVSGPQGSTLVPWAPPTPPPGTGTHRYIFGLFLQPGPLDSAALAGALTRPFFNPARFAEQHGLRQIDNKRIAVSAGPLA